MEFANALAGFRLSGKPIGKQVSGLVLQMREAWPRRQTLCRHVNAPFKQGPVVRDCRQKGSFAGSILTRVDFCPFRGLGAPLTRRCILARRSSEGPGALAR